MTEKEMRGFEDLECYQLAMNVFHEGYKVASLLPSEEKYNLADQLRRDQRYFEHRGGIWALSLLGQPSFLLYCPRFHHGSFERFDRLP